MTAADGRVPLEVFEALQMRVAAGEIDYPTMEAELMRYPAFQDHMLTREAVAIREDEDRDGRAQGALRRFVEGLGGEEWPLSYRSPRVVSFVRCGGPCGSRRVGVIINTDEGRLLVEDRGKGGTAPILIDEVTGGELLIRRPLPRCPKCGPVEWPLLESIRRSIEHGFPILTGV